MEGDAFSAGLIHDVGKLVLDRYVLDRKEEFNRLTAGGRNSMLAAEQRLLGLDHAEIGFEVCQHWNIPEAISQAIRHHHTPSNSQQDKLAYIVFIANSIANMVESMEETEGTMAQMEGIEGFMYMIDDDALAFLDLSEEDIADILHEARDSVNKLSDEMEIISG
jgi:HD-like signal output (HDOD) protein